MAVVVFALLTAFVFFNLQNQIDNLNDQLVDYALSHSHDNNEFNALQSKYNGYRANYSYSNSDYALLNDSFAVYRMNHRYNDSEHYRRLFNVYYSTVERKTGLSNLLAELGELHWNVSWDPLEKLGYLEWYLENRGWHTRFLGGTAEYRTHGNTYGSFWYLMVETSTDNYTIVKEELQVFASYNEMFDQLGINSLESLQTFERVQDVSAYIVAAYTRPLIIVYYDFTDFDWWSFTTGLPLIPNSG